jgi:hypothetical protein
VKKVLIGVGIGCGALVVLGVVGLGGAVFWAKGKVGGVVEATQQMEAQNQELTRLNSEFPFQAPAEGEALTLEEARLVSYLAVREGALPVFEDFAKKSEAFEQEHEGKESVGAAVEAVNMLAGLTASVRGSYVKSLREQKMSPREFRTITTTIYASYMAGAMEAAHQAGKEGRASFEKMVADLDAQLEKEDLADEQREALEAQRTALQEQLAAMGEMEAQAQEGAAQRAVLVKNAPLLEKYKARIEKVAHPGFDAFVMDDDLEEQARE